jgi:class 3 adenylate cyclase
MEPPQTRYAQGATGQIAYQTLGSGPLDLVFIGGQLTQIDLIWDLPEMERFLRRLANFSRVILFDRRGAGISDPLPHDAAPGVEPWADDLLRVLDAVQSKRVALFAERDACAVAFHVAALFPDRVASLILGNPSARFSRAADYPEGEPEQAIDQLCALLESNWGTEKLVSVTVPSRADDAAFRRHAARFQRASATPQRAGAHYRAFLNLDSRALLPRIQCPALLLHRARLPFFDSGRHARYVEQHIAGARRIELPGQSLFFTFEHADEALGAVEEFLTGAREHADADRRLLTVLFADVVGSTKLAAELGDAAWRDLVARVQLMLRTHVDRFRGRVVDTAGDGLFAVFEAPTAALRCAQALHDAAHAMNVGLRSGLHAGECEVTGDAVRGLVVHIGARVAGEAKADEIWVTSTLRDLVAGSAFEFARRGTFRLKGVEGLRRLFALARPEPGERDDDD